jgi:peptide deformylase
MSVYKLIENTNTILSIPIEKCSGGLDRNELKENLIETMQSSFGVGLSANQCGIIERAFVMYSDINKKEIIGCFNPKITSYSKEKVLMDEGCLTYPGLWVKVRRSENIACSYEDENGKFQEVQMFGLEARIFQHEYDHMEGTNFTNHVSKLKLDMAQKRLSKVTKKSLKFVDS